MASIDYIVLELSSPLKHETVQAHSITCMLATGEEQFLPNHRIWDGELESQVIRIELNDVNKTYREVNIGLSIAKLYHEGDRTRLLISTMFYDYDQGTINSINKLSEEELINAKKLAKEDLVPQLSNIKQDMRNIDSEIRGEFERGLE